MLNTISIYVFIFDFLGADLVFGRASYSEGLVFGMCRLSARNLASQKPSMYARKHVVATVNGQETPTARIVERCDMSKCQMPNTRIPK